MANMILDSHSMDFTMRLQFAQRGDGQWFRRCQYRDSRYGYKWSKWAEVTSGPTNGGIETHKMARLPKGGR